VSDRLKSDEAAVINESLDDASSSWGLASSSAHRKTVKKALSGPEQMKQDSIKSVKKELIKIKSAIGVMELKQSKLDKKETDLGWQTH